MRTVYAQKTQENNLIFFSIQPKNVDTIVATTDLVIMLCELVVLIDPRLNIYI